MNLFDVKLNTESIISDVVVSDEKLKIRLMELGLVIGTKIIVLKKSMCKQTLLISFNHSCFTLKDSVAKEILVKYA